MADFGLHTPVRVWTDSSAAIGISTRSGLGKLRHLETHTLWVQEKVRTGAIEVRKVRGDVNPADLFTKHLPSKDKIHQLTRLFGCEYRAGRSMAAPLLRPQSPGGGEGGQPPAAHLPTFNVVERAAHDINILPHMHSDDDIELLFPIIDAPVEGENVNDWEPVEELKIEVRSAGRRSTVGPTTPNVEGSAYGTRLYNEDSRQLVEQHSLRGARASARGDLSSGSTIEQRPPGSKRE